MKMFLIKASVVAALVTGLNAQAASHKLQKKNRSAASKVTCVALNKKFVYDEEYTLEEVKALRNSIFAQYGYEFTNPEMVREMKKRGCLKTDVVYNEVSSLTEIDKQNVAMLKSIETELSEYAPMDFTAEWAKADSSKRTELLQGSYCHVHSVVDDTYYGILNFGSKKRTSGFSLLGMLDPSKAKYKHQDSTSVSYIDSTSLRSVDSTSVYDVELPSRGTWKVDSKGNVKVSMSALNKKSEVTVAIYSNNYASTRMLECKVER